MPEGNSLVSLELQGRELIAKMWQPSERDKAFSDFYNLMYDYAYSVLSRQRINNKPLEEELIKSLLADSFIKVFNTKVKPGFVNDVRNGLINEEDLKFSCLSWIKTITSRTLIDYIRNEKKQLGKVSSATTDNTRKQANNRELMTPVEIDSAVEDCIEQVMSRLAVSFPKDCELLKLVVEGYMMKEIAEKLNTSVNTVQQRCHMARERANALRKKFC